LRQRRIFELARARQLPAMAIEEEVLRLLECVIRQAANPNIPITRVADNRTNRELVYRTENAIGARFDQSLRLSDIALSAGASVFHLCRVFRALTGFTIHSYLKRLRVRHGLEEVCDSPLPSPQAPISRVALDLGFAHHSHFTSAFRREFGAPP